MKIFDNLFTSTKKIVYKKIITVNLDGSKTERRILQHGEGDCETEADVKKMEEQAERMMDRMDKCFRDMDKLFEDF